MADGGYRKPEFWLSAGWDAVKQNGWRAAALLERTRGEWNVFTLRGELPLKELAATPVSQVSFYEADAYARWAGRRLPTEFEWEAAVEGQPVEGNFLDSGEFAPVPSTNLAQGQTVRSTMGTAGCGRAVPTWAIPAFIRWTERWASTTASL